MLPPNLPVPPRAHRSPWLTDPLRAGAALFTRQSAERYLQLERLWLLRLLALAVVLALAAAVFALLQAALGGPWRPGLATLGLPALVIGAALWLNRRPERARAASAPRADFEITEPFAHTHPQPPQPQPQPQPTGTVVPLEWPHRTPRAAARRMAFRSSPFIREPARPTLPRGLTAGLDRHVSDCRQARGRWHRLLGWMESLGQQSRSHGVSSLGLTLALSLGLALWVWA